MEQKTINQNKLQSILCIIALTFGVLVSAVLFSMPSVHAEILPDKCVSNPGHYYSNITWETYNPKSLSESIRNYDRYTDLILEGNYFFAYVYGSYVLDGRDIPCISLYYGDLITGKVDLYKTSKKYTDYIPEWYSGTNRFYDVYRQNNNGSYNIGSTGLGFKLHFQDTEYNVYQNIAYDTDLPVFSSTDAMTAYILSGDKSGLITPDVPDLTDESYTYTGFSINGKTARWTGTTERSHLKDQEVEEYTRITYGFATSEDQTLNADNFIEYDQDFAVGEKQMTIPWSEIESNKKDGEFIRQVNFIPCYRVPGAFYLGKGVKVFYKSDGTVEKIEQATIPTDSETIGNDISLIGFRYDNSFHAEWVDVWSNAVNKSAFDLDSGGQYLSLGIKAIYYDGSKSDIDFYSLDRKNLTWDKIFSDFKENNGSPIKSLYFTPYIKTGVNNPWNKGNSTVVNFDENGNTSSSFDTGDDGTVHLNDFKLTGVVWNKPVVKNGTITWTGTTPNNDLLFIPDSDTLVIATYPRYDSDLNTSYETWSTTTIGKGSINVNVDYLIDYYKNSDLAWNGEMWLTPCYKKGGVLYMGEPVIINCLKGTVSDIVVDKDTGKAEQVDKTDQNKSDADSILNVGNQFYSIINGLIGSLQQLPALLTAIFGFLPGSIINLLYASFAVIIICRILGR